MCGIPDGQRDLYSNLVQKVDNKHKSTSSSKRVASTSRAAAFFVVPSISPQVHTAGADTEQPSKARQPAVGQTPVSNSVLEVDTEDEDSNEPQEKRVSYP
jgi:hypothetical protein